MSQEPIAAMVVSLFAVSWIAVSVYLTTAVPLLQATIFGFVIALIATILVVPAVCIAMISACFLGLYAVATFVEIVMAL